MDMFMVIVGCFLALLIDWIGACKFRDIAESKGHDGGTYFWWCFCLGVIGWAMVIALPDRKVKAWTPEYKDSTPEREDVPIYEYKASKNDDELPDL